MQGTQGKKGVDFASYAKWKEPKKCLKTAIIAKIPLKLQISWMNNK